MPSPPSDIDVHALMRGLVHELRNPLSAILTASSLLQSDDNLDEESAMLLDVVQKESRRMNRILTEFSSFVKPPHPQLATFDFAHLLRSLVRELQREAVLRHSIAIHDELPATLAVHADEIQTRQVLHHVLCNAAEAMEDGGALHFSSAVEGPTTWICIQDSGTGLAQGTLEHAFQPFFSTKPTSTGLGLSIARGLLRSINGDLTLEDVGHNGSDGAIHSAGTRVKIHLPSGDAPPD
ncbi:MAG: HAMP domain-containing histidine kinase [Armatimonadetes bacterium]|nr:HAMP domain-containing histidine kinase [Armatimonadota bacterium]